MDLETYVKDVAGWAEGHGGLFPVAWNLARLTEEAGELAHAVGEVHGPKRRLETHGRGPSIAEELGDILFTLALLAHQLDVDPAKAAQGALDKAGLRDGHRFSDP